MEDKRNVKELKAAAKKAGVPGYSSLKRDELLAALNGGDTTPGNTQPPAAPPDVTTPDMPQDPRPELAKQRDDRAEAEANPAAAKALEAAQKAADAQAAGGTVGQSPDPFPNKAYSQETDPATSPTAEETRAALAEEADE